MSGPFGPMRYRSLEEFVREEIAPHKKVGFSIDDIYSDANYKRKDDSLEEEAPKELDFGF